MATILLIEDDATIRDIVRRMFERKGYQVIFAANGVEGMELARSAAPGLILMDMRLPILDGWQATQQLKADPATRSIPIIALTSQGLTSDRERCLAIGCDEYEAKPIYFERLLAKVESLLAGQAPGACPAAGHEPSAL